MNLTINLLNDTEVQSAIDLLHAVANGLPLTTTSTNAEMGEIEYPTTPVAVAPVAVEPVAPVAPVEPVAPVAPVAVAQVAPVAPVAPVQQPAPVGQPIDLAVISAKVQDINLKDKSKLVDVRQALNDLGVNKASELQPAQHADFYAKIQNLV